MELEAYSSRTVWIHADDITSFRIVNQSLCKNIYQLNVRFIERGVQDASYFRDLFRQLMSPFALFALVRCSKIPKRVQLIVSNIFTDKYLSSFRSHMTKRVTNLIYNSIGFLICTSIVPIYPRQKNTSPSGIKHD